MSEVGSQDDDRSQKELDSESVEDEEPNNHGPKQISEMNKKLYCICQ